jgi:hypothetical protein
MATAFKNLELQKIVENQNEGQRFLWFTLLDNAREPFHNLCALLSRGKGFCAPASILQRKKAAGQLFASFAGIILTNEEELPLNVAISFRLFVYINSDVSVGYKSVTKKCTK